MALVVGSALAMSACADTPVSPISADAPPSFSAGNSDVIPGRFIVTLRDGSNAAGVAREHGVTPDFVYSHALNGFAGNISEAARSGLLRDARVVRVEQDGMVYASTTQTGATWGIDRVDQRNLPLSGSYTYTNTGAGVTAYIIDTGIDYAHAEFGGRASFGYDALAGNGNDCHGHGTHVAGTTGGATYGIAKGVTFIAVRVLDCAGSGTNSGVIAGIDWVTAHHAAGTPAVANMSLGGGANTSVDAAVRRMIADGVATSIAAGNGNILGWAQDACTVSPARVTEGMTIGATTNTDAKASYSNYGNCVDFFAPGSGVTSAWIGVGNTETKSISGTSMAAPHVAGVAAQYLQSNPGASPQQVRDALYAATTKAKVTSARTVNNHLLFTSY